MRGWIGGLVAIGVGVVAACSDDAAPKPAAPAGPSRIAGEGEFCGPTLATCKDGLTCTPGSRCAVPGKAYVACETRPCLSTEASGAPTGACTCGVPSSDPDVTEMAFYDTPCGGVNTPRTRSSCCKDEDGCLCRFLAWTCTDLGSICYCHFTSDDPTGLADATQTSCDKANRGAGVRCCYDATSKFPKVGNCTCGVSKCEAGEIEVSTCGATLAVPDEIPTLKCGDDEGTNVPTCRGSGEARCYAATTSSASSSSSSGASAPPKKCDPTSCRGSQSSCSDGYCFSCYYSCDGDRCASKCTD